MMSDVPSLGMYASSACLRRASVSGGAVTVTVSALRTTPVTLPDPIGRPVIA